MKRIKLHESPLTDRIEITVRFSEVDMMKVAWHGSYVAYLEDGREHFGIRYAGIGYEDYFRTGYVAPVVNMNIDYHESLKCGEKAIVETRYVPSVGAKLILEYVVYRASDMQVMAIAQTTQVFMTASGEMQYAEPEFFAEWKKRWLETNE
ncbi:MAG: acyl-CoA thioesterase [Bacteroidales bacterium]|nr:acyl-CoA thioesterase [Bacteroidales bacterium]